MIVYACAVSDGDVFARCAEPGIRRVADADADAEMLAQPSAGTIFRNYNLLCEQVAGRDDLEALVLLHQDVEIVDADFSANVRRALVGPRRGDRRLRGRCRSPRASRGGRDRSPGRR